ncbi:MAG: AAA family ATPase [Candidatus Riflebacteria bacterium]|nr:AAA family ATPase [Candidatus Riflebacteria bacterium]
MARCSKCSREMPLSGRCPFCEKAGATGGFSLGRFSGAGGIPAPSAGGNPVPDPRSEALHGQVPPAGQPGQRTESNISESSPSSPLPSSQQTDVTAAQRHSSAQSSAPATPGSILSGLRAKITGGDSGNVGSIKTSSEASIRPPVISAAPANISTGDVTQQQPVRVNTEPHVQTVEPSISIPAGVGSTRINGPVTDSEQVVPAPASAQKIALPKKPAPVVREAPSLNTPATDAVDMAISPAFAGVKSRQTAKSEDVSPGNRNPDGASLHSSSGFGDEEMECSVLSGLLNDNYILEQATSKGLIVEMFSTRYSRGLCKAIIALREDNRENSLIDKIIIKSKLQQQGAFDGPMQGFLNRVMAQPSPSLDQVLHYLELLKDQGLKRKLREISDQVVRFIDVPDPDHQVSIENFANGVIAELRDVQKAKTTKRINLVKEEMREIMKDIDDREIKGEIEIIGYSFEPFHYLNVAISGFRKGFMYAIAGAPRRGKTTFTLELATAVATNCKIPVLFFTYEQTKKNLTYRLLAKESRLNPDSLQRKKVRSDMIMDAKFMGGWKRMQSYMDYFYIVEATKADTIDRIRSYAYNVMQDFNTNDVMIFIDYIQKMPLSKNYTDEKFKVEEISTELKALCIELNNPIMTISSLSKEGCMIDATANAERPTMYHCKGSGDLEYDLDCAMIQAKDWGDTKELHQQLMQKAEETGKDPTRVPKVDVVNLYLDKNRDAPEGIYSTMQYLFFIEDNKFIELGPKYDDDRFRYSKIEQLVSDLIERNFIIFHERQKDYTQQKGRVSIKLKNA